MKLVKLRIAYSLIKTEIFFHLVWTAPKWIKFSDLKHVYNIDAIPGHTSFPEDDKTLIISGFKK